MRTNCRFKVVAGSNIIWPKRALQYNGHSFHCTLSSSDYITTIQPMTFILMNTSLNLCMHGSLARSLVRSLRSYMTQGGFRVKFTSDYYIVRRGGLAPASSYRNSAFCSFKYSRRFSTVPSVGTF